LVSYQKEVNDEQKQLLNNFVNSVKFSVTLDKLEDNAVNKQYNIEALDLGLKLDEGYEVTISDGATDNIFLTATATDGTKIN